MKRPALPDLKVGDTIIAKAHSFNATRMPEGRQRKELVIFKVARTYLYAAEAEHLDRSYRTEYAFHRETQLQKASAYSPDWRFVTPEQDAWEVRQNEARDYLNDAIGRIGGHGRGRYEGNEVVLANIIRGYECLPNL